MRRLGHGLIDPQIRADPDFLGLGVGKIWGSLICGMMVLLREDGHGCADLDGNNL